MDACDDLLVSAGKGPCISSRGSKFVQSPAIVEEDAIARLIETAVTGDKISWVTNTNVNNFLLLISQVESHQRDKWILGAVASSSKHKKEGNAY